MITDSPLASSAAPADTTTRISLDNPDATKNFRMGDLVQVTVGALRHWGLPLQVAGGKQCEGKPCTHTKRMQPAQDHSS